MAASERSIRVPFFSFLKRNSRATLIQNRFFRYKKMSTSAFHCRDGSLNVKTSFNDNYPVE